MNIEFDYELMPQKLLEVSDLGNFAVEASNEDGYYYYMIVKTEFGIATVMTCGPVAPDVEHIPSGFKTTLNRVDYKEQKLIANLKFFLNDKTAKITEAKIIEIEDALEQFRSLKEYIENGNY